MRSNLLLLLSIVFISACQNTDKELSRKKDGSSEGSNFNKTSIDLNNQAMELVRSRILSDRPDTSKALRAIALLDSAISLDSSYYLAYSNKATVLCGLGRKSESIRCLETIINKSPSYAEGTALLGMLYESVGDLKRAMTCYDRSLRIFQDRFLQRRDLSSRQNEVFMFLLLGEHDSVRVRLSNLAAEFPSQLKAVEDFEDFVRGFERGAYISGICSE